MRCDTPPCCVLYASKCQCDRGLHGRQFLCKRGSVSLYLGLGFGASVSDFGPLSLPTLCTSNHHDCEVILIRSQESLSHSQAPILKTNTKVTEPTFRVRPPSSVFSVWDLSHKQPPGLKPLRTPTTPCLFPPMF